MPRGPVAAEPNVAATGQPTISGTAQVGEDLTADTSGISDGNGLTSPTYSYQWLRAGTAAGTGSEISGARSTTYRLVEADQGKYLRVRVSFQDDDGNAETATSDATGPVSAEPNVAATGQPTISGTAQVGGQLTAGTSGISDGNGLTTVSYSYQWLRAETASAAGEDISGATSATYAVVEADQGKYVRVRVSFQDDDGNAETATSDARGPVAAEANVAATGQPTISGTARVGQDLSASVSGIGDGNGLTSPTYSYQWLRANTAAGTGSEISGARSTTYRLVEADQGKYVRVQVSFADDDGNDESATSDAKGPGGCRAERGGDGPADDQRDSPRRRGSDREHERDQRRERPDESELRLPVAACGHGYGDRQRDIGSKERDLQAGGGGPRQVRAGAGELPGRRRE